MVKLFNYSLEETKEGTTWKWHLGIGRTEGKIKRDCREHTGTPGLRHLLKEKNKTLNKEKEMHAKELEER